MAEQAAQAAPTRVAPYERPHRRPVAAFAGVLALAAALAAWFVVAAGPGLLPAQAVLLGVAATASAGALLALAVVAARVAVGTLAVRTARPGTSAERVEAPTPFWCAVEVARRPSRPRAPGGR